MTTSPEAVRAAIADYIAANIPGLRSMTDPGSIANPPLVVVLPAQGTYINYLECLEHGVFEMTIRITVLVSRAIERVAMTQVDSYLAPYGTLSVPAAIL